MKPPAQVYSIDDYRQSGVRVKPGEHPHQRE
jgi:hypothetical protein